MKKNKILVISAHPDDEVLGCGGMMINSIQEGHIVHVLFLAEGISARYDGKFLNNKRIKKEIVERNKNCLESLSVIGIPKNRIYFNNFQCCRLDTYPLIEITKIIEGYINLIKPNIIFTHNNFDINVDHQIVNKATIAACRPINKNYLNEIYTYEVLSSTEWNTSNNFNPQLFVDITKSIKQKIRALKKYKKEILKSPNSRSIEKTIAMAEYRGAFVGYKYAEAFQLFRSNKL